MTKEQEDALLNEPQPAEPYSNEPAGELNLRRAIYAWLEQNVEMPNLQKSEIAEHLSEFLKFYKGEGYRRIISERDQARKSRDAYLEDARQARECILEGRGQLEVAEAARDNAMADRDKLAGENVGLRFEREGILRGIDTLRAELEAAKQYGERSHADFCEAHRKLLDRTAELEAVRKEQVNDAKPSEIMFAVYARDPGSNNWFEQESNTDESLVREWRDRNNERSAEFYDPPREYILVKKETYLTKLQ